MGMSSITTDMSVIEAGLQQFPADQSLLMVNLLRYRATADYAAGGDGAPCSGREAYYQRYAAPTFDIIRRLGGRVFSFSHVQIPIFAPKGENWDDVLLVEYPSFAALKDLVTDPGYQALVVHRMAALADTRVFATTRGTEIA